MKNLLIVGAGPCGREVYAWATQARECGVEWNVGGFLDSRSGIMGNYDYGVNVIGSPDKYRPGLEDLFVCAVGEPAARRRYCSMLLERGAQFATITHPTVVLGENIKMGLGVILCPNVTISCDVCIGDFVTVNMHSFIAHDVTVGRYCQIHGHVSINGGVVIGEEVLVGSNASILPNIVVGDGAIVGAGSIVLQNVASQQTVFGNPAKSLGLPRQSVLPVQR